MKKILLCIVLTASPYLLLAHATTLHTVCNLRNPNLEDLSATVEVNWEKLITAVSPAMNPDFEKLSDKDRAGLNGRVQTVRTISAEFLCKGDKCKKLNTYGEYEKVYYDTDGELFRTESNRRLGCGFRGPAPLIKMVYDDRGRLRTELSFMGKNALIRNRTTYAYDVDGKILEKCVYDSKGELAWKQIYQYRLDSYGNWTEQIPILMSVDEAGPDERVYGMYRQITYYKK